MSVQRRYLDHEIYIDSSNHRAAQSWCKEHLGERWSPISNRTGLWSIYWAGRENIGKYRVCFATEKDAIWFALRWA
jgi:hypothetical protein